MKKLSTQERMKRGEQRRAKKARRNERILRMLDVVENHYLYTTRNPWREHLPSQVELRLFKWVCRWPSSLKYKLLDFLRKDFEEAMATKDTAKAKK